MCLGMNPDKLTPGQRSASTSNRNEGRQARRAHPSASRHVAAAAVSAHLLCARLPAEGDRDAGLHDADRHRRLPKANVDTDQIILARFRSRSAARFGKNSPISASGRWQREPRFRAEPGAVSPRGSPHRSYNFGCGSREHAPGAARFRHAALSPPTSPTSSTTTASRTACCPSASEGGLRAADGGCEARRQCPLTVDLEARSGEKYGEEIRLRSTRCAAT